MNEQTLSILKEKQIYIVRDMRISNPRRLFRQLNDVIEHLGYESDYSTDSVDIKRDEVGESGYVNAGIHARKNIEEEKENAGSRYVDFSRSSPLQRYVLIAGIIAFFAGIVMLFSGLSLMTGILSLVGILAVIVTLLTMTERKTAIYTYPVFLWIVGAGEIYRVHMTESRGASSREQGVARDQVVSELTVRLAAESDPPMNLEELDSDIRYLVRIIDSAE